ncbi:MAG TPA: LysR substrate-binding domain-containing protein [Novosphingobium sp.]|nr:LysR substrate-binding domain-containing protein [Novosphingobium sp.]HZV09142.1 LysR substrate-binding domain-containing protein [Novosphingobium sp.]
MPANLPTNLLRSFVAIVETGSMLGAADKVFLTQSALSLQIKRLEQLLQLPLFHRDGRRLSLTGSGEIMVDYARRILQLQDEAINAVTEGRFAGPARIGMVQDFAETLLSGLLAQFARLHPDAILYSRVAGTVELLELLERDQLDIVLGFAGPGDAHAITRAPMGWYGKRDLASAEEVRLAVLEAPCRFRDAAMQALDNAGRPYRITVETPNLTTLRAAVEAGLGITCRTRLFCEDEPLIAADLPELPDVSCIMRTGPALDGPTDYLATLVRETVSLL